MSYINFIILRTLQKNQYGKSKRINSIRITL
jgi:hypothetical protein